MFSINSKYDPYILEYCKLNNITDIELFVTQCFKQGFDIKKYGFLGKTEEIVKEVEVIKEVEKIIEKRVEIPVEIIKEVEVVREVEVEKQNDKSKMLSETLMKLKSQLKVPNNLLEFVYDITAFYRSWFKKSSLS